MQSTPSSLTVMKIKFEGCSVRKVSAAMIVRYRPLANEISDTSNSLNADSVFSRWLQAVQALLPLKWAFAKQKRLLSASST